MNEEDTMPVIEQSVVDALRAAARDHNIGSFLTEVAAHDMAAAVRDAEVERLREAIRGERGDPLLDQRDDLTEARLLERLARAGLLTATVTEARARLDA